MSDKSNVFHELYRHSRKRILHVLTNVLNSCWALSLWPAPTESFHITNRCISIWVCCKFINLWCTK